MIKEEVMMVTKPTGDKWNPSLDKDKYVEVIKKSLQAWNNVEDSLNVEEMNHKLAEIMKSTPQSYRTLSKNKTDKLSASTRLLLTRRRELRQIQWI